MRVSLGRGESGSYLGAESGELPSIVWGRVERGETESAREGREVCGARTRFPSAETDALGQRGARAEIPAARGGRSRAPPWQGSVEPAAVK